MAKESRNTIRLIALWVMLAAGLAFSFWTAGQLVISLAKTANGGYEANYLNGGYSNYCLQQPVYPATSSMGGYAPTEEDKMAMETYNKDLGRYYENLQSRCEDMLTKQVRSSALGEIFAYCVLALLGIATILVSLISIQIAEASN